MLTLRTLVSATCLAALLATAPATQAQTQPPPAETPVGKALEKVSQGDVPGAVEILEPLRRDPQASPLAKALLGTLLIEVGRSSDAYEVLSPLAEVDGADPAVLYNIGRAAKALGRQGEAESYFERSAARDPGSVAARELGLIRRSQGRTADAYRLLRGWINANPRDLEAMLAAGHCAVELQRAPEAEQIAASLPQNHPEASLIRAKLAVLKGDPAGGIALAEPHLAAATPELAREIRLLIADAHLRNGSSDAAVAVLQGHEDESPLLRLFLARAVYQQGRLQEAAKLFAPLSLRLLGQSDDPLPLGLAALGSLEYGRVLMAGGNAPAALPYLERTTEIAPSERQGWQALGQALLLAGRQQEGEAALARFQQLVDAQGTDAWRKVPQDEAFNDPTARKLADAMRWLQSGESDKALAEVRQEQQLNPEDPRPWLHEVHVLLLANRVEEASAAAEKVVGRFPGQPDALYLRGLAGMALKKTDAAEKDLRKVLEIAPEHTAAMNDLAVLLMLQQRGSEAAPLLRKVLELRPDDANAKANLEQLEKGQG